MSWGALTGASAVFNEFTHREEPKANDNAWETLRTLGVERVLMSTEQAFQEFTTLKYGAINARYQLFWDIGNNLDQLSTLDAISDRKFVSKDEQSRFRQKMIGKLARIHGISEIGDPKLSNKFEEDISLFAAQQIDPSIDNASFGYGRIASLEVLWANVTAAIVRDRYSWHTIQLDVLARAAINFVRFYQREDFPELVCPAICALQFLLTYDRALRSRSGSSNSHEIHAELAQIEEVSKSTELFWFLQLFEIYASIGSYESSLPQYGELILGNTVFPKKVRKLVVLSRLESIHQRRTKARIGSPYVQSSDKPNGATQTIFRNFGYEDSQISELFAIADFSDPKKGPGVGFRTVALEYLSNTTTLADGQLDESEERRFAPSVRSLIPFRFLSERSILYSHRRNLPTIISQITHSSSDITFQDLSVDLIVDTWKHLGNSTAREITLLCKKELPTTVIKDRVDALCEQLISSIKVQSSLEQLKELYPVSRNFAFRKRDQTDGEKMTINPSGSDSVLEKENNLLKGRDERDRLFLQDSFWQDVEIWITKLGLRLKKEAKGKVVALDHKSGRYLLAETEYKAILSFREKFGADTIAYVERL